MAAQKANKLGNAVSSMSCSNVMRSLVTTTSELTEPYRQRPRASGCQ